MSSTTIGRVILGVIILAGLIGRFAYCNTKKKLLIELGFLVLAAGLTGILFFPAMVYLEKVPPGKAALFSLTFGPMLRYFYWGITIIYNVLRLSVRSILKRDHNPPAQS